MNKKNILTVGIIVVMITGMYFLIEKKTNNQSSGLSAKDSPRSIPSPTTTLTQESPSSSSPRTDTQKYGTSTEAYNSYVGVISQNVNGQNVYTSQKYHLRFTYPQGWRVDDNHLGYGSFQLFNFKSEVGQKGYIRGQNKIEAGITIIEPQDFGKNTDFPTGYSTTTKVTIAGELSIRLDVNYQAGGVRLVSYIIPIPNTLNKYFGISMYGDPSNFSVLDDLVKSIEWIPQELPN